jgi:hypothetical protein
MYRYWTRTLRALEASGSVAATAETFWPSSSAIRTSSWPALARSLLDLHGCRRYVYIQVRTQSSGHIPPATSLPTCLVAKASTIPVSAHSPSPKLAQDPPSLRCISDTPSSSSLLRPLGQSHARQERLGRRYPHFQWILAYSTPGCSETPNFPRATVSLSVVLELYSVLVERGSCRFLGLVLLQGFAGWPSLIASTRLHASSVLTAQARCAEE